MTSISDIVFDAGRKRRVQVVDKQEVWDFVTLTVFDPTENRIYKMREEDAAVAIAEDKCDVDYIRFVALLEKVRNEVASGVLAKLSHGIIPLPHQYHVLTRVLGDNNIRYILADEVGLGKTIEAGLIIKELKARGLIRRILVVCPTGLVTQWGLEMQEKFDEKFHVIVPDDYATIRKLTDSDDIFSQFDQVISPMDSIKPLEERKGWSQERVEAYNNERVNSIISSGWDLVVIDEAHRVAGSTSDVARHKLGRLLADASPYLLLLTATPHNGKSEPFLRLVRLVDRKAFPSVEAIVKEQVAPYLIRTEKREAIDNDGNRLFKNRTTTTVELTWDERHTEQRLLYDLVTSYVATSYNKVKRAKGEKVWVAFLLIMLQRLVTSSTSAIRHSLKRRIRVLESQEFNTRIISDVEASEIGFEDDMNSILAAVSLGTREEIIELQQIAAVAGQAEYQYNDVKVEPLFEIVERVLVGDASRKIIIFTEFIDTQVYLNKLLENRGYSVSILNGSMSIEERNEVLSEFKMKTSILISTDAGGEGLNLQFSSCVINYDLPWNPMKIEQRIGRVDRIGQTRDIEVYNFVLTETVESKVKKVLEEKLDVVLRELGIDKYSDILDGESAELNFTDAYMKAIRYKGNAAHSTEKLENDLRSQLENTLAIKDILHEDKDLQSMIGAEMTFDVENALQRMVASYERYKGMLALSAENFSINDKKVAELLAQRIEQAPDASLASVFIKGLANEAGYFMLWHLSLSEDKSFDRTVPVFVNDSLLLRPTAGQKIWEALVDPGSDISVSLCEAVDMVTWGQLDAIARDFAHDVFHKQKSEFERKQDEQYNKYLYALKLRFEAARHIGIDNIRIARVAALEVEEAQTVAEYSQSKKVFPEFWLELLVRMEAGR